jgi:hypothetical protein
MLLILESGSISEQWYPYALSFESVAAEHKDRGRAAHGMCC